MKTNLIGISGKIGFGKDTVGEIIRFLWDIENTEDGQHLEVEDFIAEPSDVDSSNPYQIKKFADEIKDTVCRWIGCTREQLEDREFKEKELGEEWRQYFNDDYDLVCEKENAVIKNKMQRKTYFIDQLIDELFIINEYNSLWNHRFLKEYATALIKRQWGTNLIKFDGMTLPGGVTVNARLIYEDALADIERMMTNKTLIRMTGITKRFPGVVANNDVDFDLHPGEIHCQ